MVRPVVSFSLNIQDNTGCTPLHIAAGEIFDGCEGALRILTDAKVNPKIVNHSGHTALHFAVASAFPDFNPSHDFKRLASVRHFIEQCNMPVNIATTATSGSPGGMTPLHLACNQACLHIAQYLLWKGANPQHMDNMGRNALHWLCIHCSKNEHDKYPIFHQLMEVMPFQDLDIQDAEGKTACDLAYASDRTYRKKYASSNYPAWMDIDITDGLSNDVGEIWQVRLRDQILHPYRPLAPLIHGFRYYVTAKLEADSLQHWERMKGEKPWFRCWKERRAAYQFALQ
jgi:hypothetical protein